MLGEAPGRWSGVGQPKILWHTTETAGLPDYDPDDDNITGEYAPHLTYWPRERLWVQDYPLNRPSESLRRFDDDQVYQIEIICYSQRSITVGRPSRIWVGNLKNEHYADLAKFPIWLSRYVEIPDVWPEKQALSYRQANASGFRFTPSQFFDWHGHLGHQHAPSPNTHWDPGAFDWSKLMAAIAEDDMTHTQARLEIAAGWHAKAGVWMSPGGGESASERLTRLADEVAAGKRTVHNIVSFAPVVAGPHPNEPVPAWVLDRNSAEGSLSGGSSVTQADVNRTIATQVGIHAANPDAHHE